MPPAIPTITIGSGLGAAAILFTAKEPSKLLGILAFAVLWTVQFVAWGFWYTFIYPFFLSPLRKLPTPKGWHLGTGHTIEAIGKGIGVTAREW